MNQAINTICPWSGDSVSEDSLAQYRGFTVGFCNPGCRDKFEKATVAFDAKIAERQSAGDTLAPGQDPVYQTRWFASADDPLEVGAAVFKLYFIDHEHQPSPDTKLNRTVRTFLTTLIEQKSVPATAPGFVIVHRGEDAHWLLVHWWSGGGILHGITFQTNLDSTDFSRAEPTVIACVWEQVVITHEREAWVRRMMCAKADAGAYLRDVLSDGAY